MPNADIGANGAVWIGLETTYGTPADPSAAGVGVWCPVLSETLAYQEPDRYYSEQIRQEVTYSDVKMGYYHAAGPIVMEVDPNFMPYFMVASRHDVVQSAGPAPFVYTATPSKLGATYPGGSGAGLSIGVIRDAVGFLYSGQVVGQYAFTIENGVLRCTADMMGLAEQDMADDTAVTESWVAADLFGADAHEIRVDAEGLTPAFSTADRTFNGFTFTINHNCEPQNRIVRDRAATYVKYGLTEISYDTELDFVDKTEYAKFRDLSSGLGSIRFESINGGSDWASATSGFRITAYRTVYNTYEVGLAGMADLVMARVNGRAIGIAGGTAYTLECKSSVDLGL